MGLDAGHGGGKVSHFPMKCFAPELHLPLEGTGLDNYFLQQRESYAGFEIYGGVR